MFGDRFGFHPFEKYIKQNVETFYDGIRVYMNTFLDPIPFKDSEMLRDMCSKEYDSLVYDLNEQKKAYLV